jgi:hypothetical protein
VSDPIGLTRAEEANQQQTETVPTVRATLGQPSCRITVPPEGNACGALADRRILWHDGEATPACENCAMRMTQLAESHKTILRVEPLTATKR